MAGSDFVPYDLRCNKCQQRFASEGRVPIQSQACDHSVCAGCLIDVRDERARRGAPTDVHISCHDCQAENAYHLTTFMNNHNGLAVAALGVMESLHWQLRNAQSGGQELEKNDAVASSRNNKEIPVQEFTSISPSSSSEEKVAVRDSTESQDARSKSDKAGHHDGRTVDMQQPSTPTISQVNQASSAKGSTNTPTTGRAHLEASSPTSQQQNQSEAAVSSAGSSEQHQHRVVSPIPGERKLVFVKFDKASHLAYLLSVNGDKAMIQWESNKFEEEVPVHSLEEIDTDASSRGRPKRTRNNCNNSGLDSPKQAPVKKKSTRKPAKWRRNSFQSPSTKWQKTKVSGRDYNN